MLNRIYNFQPFSCVPLVVNEVQLKHSPSLSPSLCLFGIELRLPSSNSFAAKLSGNFRVNRTQRESDLDVNWAKRTDSFVDSLLHNCEAISDCVARLLANACKCGIY